MEVRRVHSSRLWPKTKLDGDWKKNREQVQINRPNSPPSFEILHLLPHPLTIPRVVPGEIDFWIILNVALLGLMLLLAISWLESWVWHQLWWWCWCRSTTIMVAWEVSKMHWRGQLGYLLQKHFDKDWKLMRSIHITKMCEPSEQWPKEKLGHGFGQSIPKWAWLRSEFWRETSVHVLEEICPDVWPVDGWMARWIGKCVCLCGVPIFASNRRDKESHTSTRRSRAAARWVNHLHFLENHPICTWVLLASRRGLVRKWDWPWHGF